MGFETLGVAVEHGPQIFGRRTRCARQDAGGGYKVADIRVFRPQLQRLGISLGGLRVASETGEGVAHQAERAGVGYAGDAGLLGKGARCGEVAATDAEQNCGVA
jgi:hypothetical protein